MDIETLRDYCLLKDGATEHFPFGPDTLVFKVSGKIFLIAGLDSNYFNAKCDPERAIELRDEYEAITPGYHMNKQHWNSVCWDGRVPEKLLQELVDGSYELVAKKPNGK